MNHTFLVALKKGIPLFGGLRKRCFLVKAGQQTLVYSLWSKGVLSKAKIEQTIRLENLACEKGLPCRKWRKIGQGWLKKIIYENKSYWLGIGGYLPGEPLGQWEKGCLLEAGRVLAGFHKKFLKQGQTLLHLDFARGNLLFQGGRITGILDLEEARRGLIEEDIACSLSFLEEESWKNFLEGYSLVNKNFNYDKIKPYFYNFLKKRMAEGNKQAFLLLAKKRLEDYQQANKDKLLTLAGLEKFAKTNSRKKIVFTLGAFELLHWGHLEYLEDARNKGDLLVVGVVSDQSRRKLKGVPYPLISDRTRAETMAHFNLIDGVVIIDEESIAEELKALKPKVFYTAKKDWEEGVRKPAEEELLKNWDGVVVKTDYTSCGMPSSKMVETVADYKLKQVLFGGACRQPLLQFNKKKKIAKEVKFLQLEKLGEKFRQEGKTVVFTSMTADLFHLGHARFILKAKSLGDVLVVGLPNNESVAALKGPGRPMVDEEARALVVSMLDLVDNVVIFDERTILGCLKKLKPDVFFTVKEDWNNGLPNSPEAKFMKSINGKVVCSERQAPYLSASKIIDKAAGELIQKKFNDLLQVARETPVLDADGFDPHSPRVQLAAREQGFYDKVLEAVAKRGKCVFCDLKDKYLVAEKNKVVLTVALFPYIDGHLLIIPRRHVESMEQLNDKEKEAVFWLSKKGREMLKEKLGVENTWFLLREGNGIQVGKTVNHLHFHLIPYDPRVIKMGETNLTIAPLELAAKLRRANG